VPDSPFVALRHRNFRLLWSGQLLSICGTQMQMAAILWHISLIVPADRRGLALGLVGLARIFPVVVFSLVAGVAADALNRRRVMLWTQGMMAVFSAILASATFNGLSSVWPIYALSAASAAAASFDLPARQALIPSLVPRAHLPNAISLNTTMFQVASVAGPSLAGVVIAWKGVGWVYLIDALSFLIVIGALLLMRGVPDVPREDRAAISLGAALDGLRFVFREPMIRSTMLMDFCATFFSSATALLPIFAQDVLRVGPRGYGWLYAAPGIGAAMTSAIMVRLVNRIDRRGLVLVVAVLVYGLATILFGLSESFWLTFACLVLVGAADTVSTILRGIIRQLRTPDHLRGRMVGVNMVFFVGGPQLGELESGLAAHWLGAPRAVMLGGAGCMAVTALIVSRMPRLLWYRREELVPAVHPAAADPAARSRLSRPSAPGAA
jgi:MFS family permease